MSDDPFENFGEQMRSFELLEEHRSALMDEARDMMCEHPDTEVVGLILDADAEEAESFRALLEESTGQDLAGRGFLGVAPRQFAVNMLLRDAPASLEWLPSSTTREDQGEVVKWLPLIALTKTGVRFGAVRLEEEEDLGDNE